MFPSILTDDDIVIKVNTSLLESSGEWVNVSWSGVSNPIGDDWIGVYSPPVNNSIDPAAYAPVKFQVILIIIAVVSVDLFVFCLCMHLCSMLLQATPTLQRGGASCCFVSLT